MSLLSPIIEPGAFGIERPTLLYHGLEPHPSSLFTLRCLMAPHTRLGPTGTFWASVHQPQPRFCKSIDGLTGNSFINWLRGPMARRLTTNQEIPGSTPGVIILLHLFCSSFCYTSGGNSYFIGLAPTSFFVLLFLRPAKRLTCRLPDSFTKDSGEWWQFWLVLTLVFGNDKHLQLDHNTSRT